MKRYILILLALALVVSSLLTAVPASAADWRKYYLYVYLDGVPIASGFNLVAYDSVNDLRIVNYEIRSSTDYVFYLSYAESSYLKELLPVKGASIPDKYLDGSWTFTPEVVDSLALGSSPVDCIFNASVELSESSKFRCYPSDISVVLNSLRDGIGVSSVVSALAFVAGVIVGLVFMWWGLRKVYQALMQAFRKGRVKM